MSSKVREMRVRAPRIPLFLLLITSLLFATQKVKEKDLSQKYRDWLKLTKYIMLKQERDVFLQLTADYDRDLFIESFWKQRDPTPGTPQNEYKEELSKRFLYANENFGRGSSKEGWMTDMGRIYITLGPPISIDRFPSGLDLYPCEVWSYYGDVTKGLPSHFSLVFFQRGGVGEYKLYSPISDGPASLLVQGKNMDPFDYEKLYEKIVEVAPDLAPVCLSLIPGDIPYDFRPSPQDVIILANILESPKKDINPVYSTHFLNYKGIVSTEYLTNYVESTADIAFIQDPIIGINFLNFSIVPKSISIDYYEPRDQYFCNFTLSVSLKKNEDTIFQYTKEFPYYFPSQDLKRVRSNGVSIEDSFPVIAGKYELNILLQNSVGKEFSVFEKEIEVPKDSGLPQISGLFLGYNFYDYDANQHAPFKSLNKKLLVDPKNTFSQNDNIAVLFGLTNLTEDLLKEGQVKVFINGLREQNPTKKSFTLELKSYPYKSALNIDCSIPAKELTPDYYEMKLALINGRGEVIDEKSAKFIISMTETISHPIARIKAMPVQNSFLFFYMLAEQYDKLRDYENADANYEEAYSLNTNYKRGIVEYSNFLLKIKKFEKSLELIENAKGDERLKFDYYLIKGQAQMGLSQYQEAIESLLEGNKIYNSDTRLLNSLGLCFYKTNQKSKALNALNASLRLNPNQEEIKRLVAEIEKKSNS